MIASIETGGTKVVCAVVDPARPERVVESVRFPTGRPVETLRLINEFFERMALAHPLDALGIASFGPVNVDVLLPEHGRISGTSKPGWDGVNLLDGIALARTVPTTLMTDVAGAALAEQRLGAGKGFRNISYATFGTGVGVGVVRDGFVFHGSGYPELGHLLVRRHPSDLFPGSCPFHGDCLEGLAAGPAISARWGADLSSLSGSLRDEALEIIGSYVAQLAVVVGAAFGSERIVLGGGVLKAPGLLQAARRALHVVSGGPGAGHPITADADDYLVPPALLDFSGVLGAAAAAADLPVEQRQLLS